MDFFGPLTNSLDSGHKFLGVILAIFVVSTITYFIKFLSSFIKNEPLLKRLIVTVVLSLISIILFRVVFYNTTKIPLNSSIHEISNKLECTHGKNNCVINNGYLEYSGYDDDNETPYECNYDHRVHVSFHYPKDNSSFSIDNIIYDIDDLKLSLDKNKFSATFKLKNPATNQMVSLKEDKFNVNICGESCLAIRLGDSTYKTSKKWSEFKTIAQQNCATSVCVKQDNGGCHSDRIFNIPIPYNQKNIALKDNTYVFLGDEKQNSMALEVDKKNFDISMDVKIINPSTCFVLEIGNNIVKIENNIVSLNKEFIGDEFLDASKPIHLQIQKPSDKVLVHFEQLGGIKGVFPLNDMKDFKNTIKFGYSRMSRAKGEVLSVNIGAVDNIRPE